MILLPAIDIHEGSCVRLLRGDYATAQQVADSPLLTARRFEEAGAQWLHMVDLDGAKERRPVNTEIFREIVEGTRLSTELGGGIRNRETIEFYLEMGVSRVILGSAALQNPELVREAARAYGERIAVGIDARGGMAAADGWLASSQVGYLDLAKAMEESGVRTIIYTDIGRDGTLGGVNLEELEAISKAVSCRIIASGGVRDLRDIAALRDLGLYGAICGKSLYQGTLRLEDALAAARA